MLRNKKYVKNVHIDELFSIAFNIFFFTKLKENTLYIFSIIIFFFFFFFFTHFERILYYYLKNTHTQ